MPATKSAPSRKAPRSATKSPSANGKRTPSANGVAHQPKAEHPVLTLSEAARFLRLTPEVLADQALFGSIPGRRIGTEWRFLKSALNDWLVSKPKKSNREAILSLVGAFKDDPTLNDILEAASRNRGRPMGRVDE